VVTLTITTVEIVRQPSMVRASPDRDASSMCGIAGLFAKTPTFEDTLGDHLADMVGQLVDRGPDSAGVAIYRAPVPAGSSKVSVLDPAGPHDWDALAGALGTLGPSEVLRGLGDQAVLQVGADAEHVRAWLAEHEPQLILMSAGHSIETFKRAGLATGAGGLIEACGLRGLEGSHAIAHTRMATESRVTTEHSHPFSTGPDLCLVHNGSLCNHNRLRRTLRQRGVSFATDNDSEVAAGYLTWRFREGDDLDTALAAAERDLDGFFTFAIGTHEGFAVVRDPIGCKPAVLAETDDWVAMASEFRAIATLPGAEDADIWEPEPGRIYRWFREPAFA
jgi:methylamine---glutamate N-methyltransferase subunit A